jgi:hypothetical protein
MTSTTPERGDAQAAQRGALLGLIVAVITVLLALASVALL